MPLEGLHLIADLGGIPAARLADPTPLMDTLRAALAASGFTVVDVKVHRFEGPGAGFTGMVLLAESHAAVHTYPEHGYLALDVFGCGGGDPDRVLSALAHALAPCAVERRAFVRRPPRPRTGPGYEAR